MLGNVTTCGNSIINKECAASVGLLSHYMACHSKGRYASCMQELKQMTKSLIIVHLKLACLQLCVVEKQLKNDNEKNRLLE